jgi:hypothetical protein
VHDSVKQKTRRQAWRRELVFSLAGLMGMAQVIDMLGGQTINEHHLLLQVVEMHLTKD